MMEPSNLGHRHLQQEQLLGSSSSSSLAASSPRVAAGSSHAWHPSLILNTDLITPTVSEEVLSTSRDLAEQSSDGLVVQLPPLTTTMVQDLCSRSTPHWEYPSSRIKEEQSHSFMKLMSSSVEDYNLHEQILLNVPAEKLLLQTLQLASGYQPDVLRLPVSAGGCPGRNWAGLGGDGRGGNYSLVLPTVTISGASPPLPPSPVQSPGFHRLLGSAGLINGELDATSSDNPSYLFKHERAFGLGSVQDRATHEPSMNQHKMSRVSVAEAKRASSSSSCDTEGSQQPNRSACKKPRVECRSSIASCKVRKEKLGDRIAALQQLVAPFGKTDTASVLMEAIGYIKFLQDQVETLSVPYLRSSGSNRASQGVPSKEVEVPKLDLRSRGLCLVPLSCTSYVTNENIVIWPPPNFMGGT